MAVDIHEMIDAPGFELIQTGTAEASKDEAAPVVDLVARLREILGYDIFEETLMAEGYREMGAEMLSISENTSAAMFEALDAYAPGHENVHVRWLSKLRGYEVTLRFDAATFDAGCEKPGARTIALGGEDDRAAKPGVP